MATVYLAEDERLGRKVAIKRLHADSPEDTERRFTREAKVGASLNHPNLVWIFDTVTDEDGVLIVMEYVDGPTLAREVSDERLEPHRAVEVVAGVAAALDYAHEEGVVHRDVKPANILLGRRGVVKLADLGIAAVTTAEHTRITQSGIMLGTASYMAPEQLEGEKITPAADIYALSAVAFETLTGRKARAGRTPLEVAHAITSKPPPDLRDEWAEAPAAAAQALLRGMHPHPEERPATAGELASELAEALGEQDTARTRLDAAREATRSPTSATVAVPDTAESSPTDDPPGPRRHSSSRSTSVPGRVVAGLAVLGAVLLVLVVVLAAGGGEEEPSRSQSGGGSTETTEDKGSGAADSQSSSVPQPANKGGAAEGARLNRQGFQLNNQGDYAQAVPVSPARSRPSRPAPPTSSTPSLCTTSARPCARAANPPTRSRCSSAG